MEKFVFIGYIKASGKLENGNAWSGYRIPVGCYGRDGNIIKVDVLKAPCTDNMLDTLGSLEPGTNITVLCDTKGRVVEIALA